MILAIFFRRASCVLLKHLVKAVGIGVSDFFADFGDVHLSGGEVNLRKLHALLCQILPKGHADVLFKDTADIDLVVIDISECALDACFDMRRGAKVAQKDLKPSWIGRVFLLVRDIQISQQMRQNAVDQVRSVGFYARGHIFCEI